MELGFKASAPSLPCRTSCHAACPTTGDRHKDRHGGAAEQWSINTAVVDMGLARKVESMRKGKCTLERVPSKCSLISLLCSKCEVTAAREARLGPAALLGSSDRPVLAQDDVNFERKLKIPRARLGLSPSSGGPNHRMVGGRGDR
jgi:hypothetical protein